MELFTYRAFLMILLCIGTINQFSQRICLSMAIICMTNHTAVSLRSQEATKQEAERRNRTHCAASQSWFPNNSRTMDDGPFAWDSQTRGNILGVFFWGYLAGQIPSGLLLRRFGARRIMLINLITFGCATALIPLALMYSVYLLYVLRIVSGLVSSAWFPGFYQIWASWAPPVERGVLVGVSFAGMQIGNAVALSMTGAFCQTSVGWPLVFYFYGACSLAYCILWLLFVYDTPSENPRVSNKEREFLMAVCGNAGRNQERAPSIPVLKMVKSLPLWAFLLFVIGYDWNNYTFLTIIPTYMREVLAFDISENAGLSSLPFLGLLLGQIFSGWLTDWILAHKLLSLNVVRKSATAIGMFVPGLVLIVISLLDCQHKYTVVAIFTFGLMFNSGVFAGGFLNPIELSPRHAGIILSTANTLSALAGVFAPMLAGALTPHGSYHEWRSVFFVGTAVYFATGMFFVCCSSTVIQPWAIDPRSVSCAGDLEIPVSPSFSFGSIDSKAAWQQKRENDMFSVKVADS
ncbi:sialin [Clonorchis sinensis]|uniref:Sialin n=1 Tax=Clonorchis sinensis TaxID=79923 RepID=G7Y8H3_CLOSI|nr:sialin [Clonorchis sinensis]